AYTAQEKTLEVENVAAQCLVYRRVGRRARRQAASPPHLRRFGRAVSRRLGQGRSTCRPLLSSRGHRCISAASSRLASSAAITVSFSTPPDAASRSLGKN